ncbi:hypothetical protein E2C01_055714 [Portunus trituberculatus]|uniref:Uncharacterized protein n=1 Tax=Portunus trituberculatus TaxID=210409 RepID=A0A5B7GNG9_PORTR|nr:hypothetical protein [Portunus trituberculatus]
MPCRLSYTTESYVACRAPSWLASEETNRSGISRRRWYVAVFVSEDSPLCHLSLRPSTSSPRRLITHAVHPCVIYSSPPLHEYFPSHAFLMTAHIPQQIILFSSYPYTHAPGSLSCPSLPSRPNSLGLFPFQHTLHILYSLPPPGRERERISGLSWSDGRV